LDKRDRKKVITNKIMGLRSVKGRWASDDEHTEKQRSRNDFQRDYARVIYSSAFRRLQGKMQLLGIDSRRYYRNRLTHSLEVAQIARSICTSLSSKYDGIHFWSFSDLFLIETICLSHDLGNPPFGHAGEVELDNLAADFGGFEGNAQTFRLLARLERKFPDLDGLNLSKRTMLGTVKYFQKKVIDGQEKTNKKFLYNEDFEQVRIVKEQFNINDSKTLDCQVMDIADEIAYGAHDLEDSLHQRFINPYDLIYMFKREIRDPNFLKDFKVTEIETAEKVIDELITSTLEYAYSTNRGDSDDLFETVFRKELSSKIVNVLVRDVDYQENTDSIGFTKYAALSAGLKKLLFNAIKNDSEKILLYERVGSKVINKLYAVYSDPQFNKDNALLSSTYRIFSDETQRKRMIVDYLSGMMDQYAVEQYIKFYGKDPFNDLF
jgi:dGTPase